MPDEKKLYLYEALELSENKGLRATHLTGLRKAEKKGIFEFDKLYTRWSVMKI
jgi:hypothetical protein